MPVEISAIICTRDRLDFLDRALASLCAQALDPGMYEIIVVDNGPDVTAGDIVEAHAARHPVRLLHEPMPGLSRARNAALAAAEGRYVAYLDDDAIAEPGWLAALLDMFRSAQPRAGTVGGRIDADWGAPRPDWLVDSVAGYLSTLDLGSEPHVVSEEVWLVGANIAFDRDALRAAGGFPEHLGRQGGKLLSGEETAVKRMLERRGLASWYAPDAVVRHYVPPERMTQRWLLRRIFWQGVTDAHHVRDRLELTEDERADIRRHWREAAKLWNWPKLAREYPAKGPFLRRTVTARALGYALARLKLVH